MSRSGRRRAVEGVGLAIAGNFDSSAEDAGGAVQRTRAAAGGVHHTLDAQDVPVVAT
ncbi:hypothetical protein L1I79_04235 [Strepomyces sp. STD 3.1]|nr:hypothetical protein [Streptomyces sp. STD 3.1]